MILPSISELFDLTGKVAVVTGGARGIGKAIAIRLSNVGAKVVLADLRTEEAMETAEEIRHQGGEAHPLQVEIGNCEDALGLVRSTLAAYKRLDIFVNNAGGSLGHDRNAMETTEEDWNHVVKVNLSGAFFCSQAAAREMIRAGAGGKIINIVSTAAFHPLRDLAHYAAAKAGVVSLTLSFAKQLASHGILVNAVAPGGVLTPAAKEFLDSAGLDIEDARKRGTPLTAGMPLGRWCEPDEVARVVLFLASGASSYMTGTTLVVDGGGLLM